MKVLGAMWFSAGLILQPTYAQSQDSYVHQGDEYQLTRESEFWAQVDYLNDHARMSPGGDVTLFHDGLTVIVHTQVNHGGGDAERMTVTAPEGWAADPPFLDVEDGQGGTIYLSRIVDALM